MSWVMVAVTAATALQQYNAGKAQKAQADLQAQQLDQQAQLERQSALEQAELVRKAGKRQRGAAAAAVAASGAKVGEGSALLIDQEISQDSEKDAATTWLNGGRKANSLNMDASMSRIEGKSAKTAATTAAVSTLAQGGYTASKGWKTASPGDGLSQGDRRKLGVY